MKAWEFEHKLTADAVPPELHDDNEADWMAYTEAGRASDKQLFHDWDNKVPGSKAPCDVVIAAVQSMHNRGYDVTEAEKFMEEGLKASEERDGAAIQVATAKIFHALNEAPKDPASPYWSYNTYRTFADVEKEADFGPAAPYDVFSDDFAKKVTAGWMGQLIGGCLGTQIEGYTTEQIRKRFGEVYGYRRRPETYNDDITYEIAYLDGFIEKGYDITPADVAYKWLELISDGYSAEKTAIENLRRGLLPPESGTTNNYFYDWIGAQMRTPLPGMLAPGNPKLAARLAADDSIVSHSNNGMLGGIFNALLTSLAFTEDHIRTVVEKAVDMIPHKSEYYAVVKHALDLCKENSSWEPVWTACEERYKEYNWIHAYPNAAAEVIALWFGNMDFKETCHIIAMEGQDADCTAAPVLNALAIMIGLDVIDDSYIKPIGDRILTTMRRYQDFKIAELCQWTTDAVRNAVKKQK